MKKKYLLGLSLICASLIVVGCDNTNNPTNQEARVIINEFEHGTATSSITGGNVGDSGILTITPESKDYRVSSVYQNEYLELYHMTGDFYSYEFTLEAGDNVFDVEMYYEEYLESDSDLIGPPNEQVVPDGELTDELDPIPVPGEEPEPTYDNPLTIYFKDASWWGTDSAGVNVVTYDEDKTVLNGTLGQGMNHVSYNNAGGFNYFRETLDGDTVKYVQFIRTNGTNTDDWGARTDVLDLPPEGHNMYILDSTPAWYGDGNYATVTTGVYDPSNDPVYSGHGTYTIYFEARPWWVEKGEDTRIYKFGVINQSWPGDAMEEVSRNEDGSILYRAEVDTNDYNKVIFNVSSGGFQTADLDLPFDEFGDDATVLATLPEEEQYSKGFGVTWSEYTPA